MTHQTGSLSNCARLAFACKSENFRYLCSYALLILGESSKSKLSILKNLTGISLNLYIELRICKSSEYKVINCNVIEMCPE